MAKIAVPAKKQPTAVHTQPKPTGKVLPDLRSPVDVAIASPGTSTAVALAMLASKDAELVRDAEETLKAKEITATGPVFHLIRLYNAFGGFEIKVTNHIMMHVPNDETKAHLDTMPEPFSGDKPQEKHPERAVSPNNFDIKVASKKRGGGKRKGSADLDWYERYAFATIYGKAIVSDLEAVTIARNAKPNRTSDPNVRDELRSWSNHDLDNEKKRLETQLRNVVKLERDTIRLHLQLQRATEKLPALSFSLVCDSAGNPRRTTEPLRIFAWGDPTNADHYSVNSFLRMDVDKAVANGGTLEALTDTIGKGADQDDDDEDESKLIFENKEAIAFGFAQMAYLVEDTSQQKAMWEYLNLKDKDGAYVNIDTAMSIVSLASWLEDQVVPKIKERVRLEINRRKEKEAERQADNMDTRKTA